MSIFKKFDHERNKERWLQQYGQYLLLLKCPFKFQLSFFDSGLYFNRFQTWIMLMT